MEGSLAGSEFDRKVTIKDTKDFRIAGYCGLISLLVFNGPAIGLT